MEACSFDTVSSVNSMSFFRVPARPIVVNCLCKGNWRPLSGPRSTTNFGSPGLVFLRPPLEGRVPPQKSHTIAADRPIYKNTKLIFAMQNLPKPKRRNTCPTAECSQDRNILLPSTQALNKPMRELCKVACTYTLTHSLSLSLGGSMFEGSILCKHSFTVMFGGMWEGGDMYTYIY